MALQKEKRENYFILRPSGPELKKEDLQKVGDHFSTEKDNVVLDLLNITEYEKKDLDLLESANREANRQRLMFVLATDDEGVRKFANSSFISHAPSLDEAMDLLIMEIMEKEMMGEDMGDLDDDDDDDFNEDDW